MSCRPPPCKYRHGIESSGSESSIERQQVRMRGVGRRAQKVRNRWRAAGKAWWRTIIYAFSSRKVRKDVRAHAVPPALRHGETYHRQSVGRRAKSHTSSNVVSIPPKAAHIKRAQVAFSVRKPITARYICFLFSPT